MENNHCKTQWINTENSVGDPWYISKRDFKVGVKKVLIAGNWFIWKHCWMVDKTYSNS